MYCTDIDHVEFSYPNGKPKVKAFVEVKSGNCDQISIDDASIQVQLEIASWRDMPVYVVVEFMHKPVQCIYVKPANEAATQQLKEYCNRSETYMSLKRYSHFQHFFRNIWWNPNEIYECLPCGATPTLKDLPDRVIKHPLPIMDW